MFLGPKITTVFASRWKALAWCGGVLLTAYCSVPSSDEDTPSAAADATATGSRVSPWAITPRPSHTPPSLTPPGRQ